MTHGREFKKGKNDLSAKLTILRCDAHSIIGGVLVTNFLRLVRGHSRQVFLIVMGLVVVAHVGVSLVSLEGARMSGGRGRGHGRGHECLVLGQPQGARLCLQLYHSIILCTPSFLLLLFGCRRSDPQVFLLCLSTSHLNVQGFMCNPSRIIMYTT